MADTSPVPNKNPETGNFVMCLQEPGLFFLFYAYEERLAGGGAVLAALVSGRLGEVCLRCQKGRVE